MTGSKRGAVSKRQKKWLSAVWLAAVVVLAAVHFWHLRADFPNGSPWFSDWAKYTDEGWYGNAALRAHLFGNWYQHGDFNPAVAVPVWPAVEWLAFAIAGVSLETARGLVALVFLLNLALSYWLVRVRAPRWAGLLAATLMAASPFLYCFSRLAILEPLLIALTLMALNVAARIDRFRRPGWAAALLGLLFALMMLTKTAAVFLAPAVGWALFTALLHDRREGRRLQRICSCAAIAMAAAAAVYGGWLTLIARCGLMRDYRYFFFINDYQKPPQWTWPLVSFYWSMHGALWVDVVLIPLAAAFILIAIAGAWRARRRNSGGGSSWSRRLMANPVFGASAWAVAGCILFMTYQDHPQPRYFAVVAFFAFIMVALAASELLAAEPAGAGSRPVCSRRVGWAAIAVIAAAAIGDTAQTIRYAAHPQYSFVRAATALTQYIDAHPNGRRLLVSVSGDQITMVTHLPALCDDFGTEELPNKLASYQPGWYATWNDLDAGTLEDLHLRYSLEQVATFPAFDDPDRNRLILFKLHPLPNGQVRQYGIRNLAQLLPGDTFDVEID